jgi:VIT1/CCC1 family predicted Fe2+/Mn2+ transporter
VVSGVAGAQLGAAKVYVTRLNPIRSGIEMLVMGGFPAFVSYGVGVLLKGIGG